jgi:hypothetical protein
MTRAGYALIDRALAALSPRAIRSLRQFAEEELVLPTGVRERMPFACDYAPFTGLVLDEIDSGRWRRFFCAAAQGSGKTLLFFIAPLLYHLFELRESVLIGLPTIDLALGIWQERLLPAIEATRFKDLLPIQGQGSRGGRFTAAHFRHGPWLRFMSASGADQQRISYACRVVQATEIGQMETPGEASQEASPLHSFEARSSSFGELARFYGEGIIYSKRSVIWHEAMIAGSGAEIRVRCPHCLAFVELKRENLKGVDEAQNEIEAREKVRLACPDCGVLWDEADRLAALAEPRLVHRGQTVDNSGRVQGPLPPTLTLGVHWTKLHTPLTTLAEIGAREYAARTSDKEADNQALCQFVWANPYEPELTANAGLTANAIRERTCGIPRGLVPAGTAALTVGIDTGKDHCYWAAVAWMDGLQGTIIDYGVRNVHPDQNPKLSLLLCLREARDLIWAKGWEVPPLSAPEAAAGGAGPADLPLRRPDLVLIDQGYEQSVIFQFIAETQVPRLLSCKGFGSKRDQGRWSPPAHSATCARGPNGEWYLSRKPGEPNWSGFHDDYYKRTLHQMLLVPPQTSGSLVLCEAETKMEHHSYAKQLVAEIEEQVVTPTGLITRWREGNKGSNHWLDATKMCILAAEMLGLRITPRASGERPLPRFRGGPRSNRRPWAERVRQGRENLQTGRRP